MASMLGFLNRLLPFATPGTPLLQDVLHLATLCVLLYFAPQIQQKLQTWRAKQAIQQGENGPASQNRPVDGIVGGEVHPEVHLVPLDNEPQVQNLAERGNAFDHMEEQAGQEAPPNVNAAAEDAQPGPAFGPDTIPPQRNVGAKKAKSLARKDQRRAYNEFMRSQGEAQRARDAEGADEREATLAAERERRRVAERQLEARKAKEREQKREREEAERKEVARRTELVLSIVRDELDSRRMCDLFQVARLVGDDVDEEWVEQVLNASGIIGKKGDTMTMITAMGWVVRITAEDMAALYKSALTADLGDEHGRISNEEAGVVLEGLLKQQSINTEVDSDM